MALSTVSSLDEAFTSAVPVVGEEGVVAMVEDIEKSAEPRQKDSSQPLDVPARSESMQVDEMQPTPVAEQKHEEEETKPTPLPAVAEAKEELEQKPSEDVVAPPSDVQVDGNEQGGNESDGSSDDGLLEVHG